MQGFSLMNVSSRCSMRSVGSSFNMSYSDSVAVFKKRFLELGLSEANCNSFNAEGLNTLGTLAFSCNFAPGSSDERPLVTLATNVLGQPRLLGRWLALGGCLVKLILLLLQIYDQRLKLQMIVS